MDYKRLAGALTIAAAFTAGGCTTPGTTTSATGCGSCGVIQGIGPADQGAQGPGVGAIVGGVAGAAVGSQIGSGKGRTAATIAGAAGGAYAGHKIEESRRGRQAVKFTVRMDDGSLRTVSQEDNPGFRVGDAVRIEGGRVVGR